MSESRWSGQTDACSRSPGSRARTGARWRPRTPPATGACGSSTTRWRRRRRSPPGRRDRLPPPLRRPRACRSRASTRRPRRRRRTARSGPRLGLALRGTDIRPDLPVVVAADSELGRQLATRAAAAFHRAEDETLTLEVEELPAGFPRFADRRQRPVTWTLIVRQGLAQAATKTYYLEGRKDYEGFRGRTDIGQIRTTGHVFVQITGGRETIDAEVDLSDVDGHQSLFRTPLAIVAWPARSAWLFATRGPDGAHLEIVELTPGTSRPRSVWQGPDGCERGDR